MRTLRAVCKSVAVLGYLVITACTLRLLGPESKVSFKRWVTRTGNRLLGLDVTLRGDFLPGPSLVVCNHSSYLDIIMLQSVVEVGFTPKIEMKRWPLIGTITTQFDAIYVDREASRTRELTDTLLVKLKQGRRLCIFPEATTNEGRSMKPFKSSLFALAEEWDGPQPLPVQPVSIRYERIDGQPLDDTTWPDVAWYGDDTLVGHLWRLFGYRKLEVTITAHPPIALLEGQNRKHLCRAAEATIHQAVLNRTLEHAA